MGYPQSTTPEKHSKTRILVQLLIDTSPDSTYFQHSEANAMIHRVHSGDVPVQHLINLSCPNDPVIRDFVQTLLRLDDLSHILAWSNSAQSVDLVEFTKLNLTFHAELHNNHVRYMCQEHNGLYIYMGDVWHTPLTAALVRGLENSLLLSDEDGGIYIMVSTVRYPIRVFPEIPQVTALSQDIARVLQGVAWPELIYDGGNTHWLSAIDTGSRHYLYKVHSSRSFLFVPTYASSLFLLLNRFLDRQYEQVCMISRTTLFEDESDNSEERAFWEILGQITSTSDPHPNAYACRLHLLLAASRQGLHSDFVVVYDLLCGIFPLSTLPYEGTHPWGALLTRHIVHRERNSTVLVSTLELLSADATLGPQLPRVPTDVLHKKSLSAILSRVQQQHPFQKFLVELQRTLQRLLQRGCVHWADTHRRYHMYQYAIRVNHVVPSGTSMVPWSFVTYSSDYSNCVLEVMPCTVGDAQISDVFVHGMGTMLLGDVVGDMVKVRQGGQRKFPLAMDTHWIMQFEEARGLIERLKEDFDRVDTTSVTINGDELVLLREKLVELYHSDAGFLETAIRSVLRKANAVGHGEVQQCWSYIFGKLGGLECLVGMDQLVECLVSSDGIDTLMSLNPFVDGPKELLAMVAAVMMTVNRRWVTAKAISQVSQVLDQVERGVTKDTLCSCMGVLCDQLCVTRHYVTVSGEGGNVKAVMDPRLLLFEFSNDLVLRKTQVELLKEFCEAAERGESRCHQMIMGQGKTTVVGPLLSVMLANGRQLFVQVCPSELLEFTKNVLRETFSAVIRKGVFTLHFSRYHRATPELYLKLLQARETGSIVVCTPTTIKSIFLKCILCYYKLREGTVPEGTVARVTRIHQRLSKIWNMRYVGGVEQSLDDIYRDTQLELDVLLRILELFSSGILLMDEIDLLLHPLKSELHWPIGSKQPLKQLEGSDHEIRWLLPWYVLAMVVNGGHQELESCIRDGVDQCHVTMSPHMVILNMQWYRDKLLPILEELTKEYLEKYMLLTQMDAVLYTREWLRTTLPYMLSKVNLVNYGVIKEEQISSVSVPLTRRTLAVPFVGKGTPSSHSEFSHPDVLIGFTMLSYMYQGLRRCDFVTALRHLVSRLYTEPGTVQDRPAYTLFCQWVEKAGGRMRCDKRKKEVRYYYLKNVLQSHVGDTVLWDINDDIPTLDVVNVDDREQVDLLYGLLRRELEVIKYYLCEILLPAAMEHTRLQVTASAMELGTSMLFPVRLGFSGTPSQLLPREMGGCHYSRGVDARIIDVLCDPGVVMGPTVLETGWTSDTVLDLVARHPDRPLALIDTGALISNMSNLEVAMELLRRGLEHVDGVVYMDQEDRQMVLLRDRYRTSLLTHCGIPPERRFTFYDQVHATGQDIRQCATAMAMITVGPNMTYRDYSQGAWRMRQVGRGQTLHLVVPRELDAVIHMDQGKAQLKIVQCLQWLVVKGLLEDVGLKTVLEEQQRGNAVRKQAFVKMIETRDDESAIDTFLEYKEYGVGEGGLETLHEQEMELLDPFDEGGKYATTGWDKLLAIVGVQPRVGRACLKWFNSEHGYTDAERGILHSVFKGISSEACEEYFRSLSDTRCCPKRVV
ncbi:uncharacterized protein BXIN_1598 [Babesia sp. Xinjiang]|uniref:uncharacterized protein n=1 Tax=Babesia sp. Xinjiang TaxID=462227 RepID=UPI000A24E906|nr:uncharacterized protein BXIN_1598 [Babesia sp. Xinjiang]ORM40231.1 hypothetical protein BXIN_1598 [Babesia sp. Xinjiang]